MTVPAWLQLAVALGAAYAAGASEERRQWGGLVFWIALAVLNAIGAARGFAS